MRLQHHLKEKDCFKKSQKKIQLKKVNNQKEKKEND